MISKTELKYFSSLLQKKYRKEESKFLVEGTKLISEAIGSGYVCEVLFYTSSFEEQHREYLENYIYQKIRCETLKKIDFGRLTDTKNPQEVLGVFRNKNVSRQKNHGKIVVALENINDPGNLGTIIRNCDWFGIESVVLSDDCAEIFNPKVIRSSAGSIFHITISEEKNFLERLTELKKRNYTIICTDLTGENIYNKKWNDKIVLVMANEANGPSNELLRLADRKVTIPKIGKAESLNVANASAVILSEITRSKM